ncbi:dihydropteroate synthase [Sessilibacter sp. MAH1]
MGILNVTPDSFYDGGTLFVGQSVDKSKLLKRVEAMLDAGADLIDVGGESTRPGSDVVTTEQELDRVVTAVDWIRQHFDTIISVDTSTPEVMIESQKAGAGLINDVRALQRPGAVVAAKATGLAVCLMHMQGEPQSMQANPQYFDLLAEVETFLLKRVDVCAEAGIPKSQIILDVGFGFGKTLDDNLRLMRNLKRYCDLPFAHLVGVSRKSMIGTITGCEVGERLNGSLALAYESLCQGAKILRVHDVKETVDIVKIYTALHSG